MDTKMFAEMATEIIQLEAALAAAEQSECDAIKHMAQAMEELKKRDHAACVLDTILSWYDDQEADPEKLDYLMDMARKVKA